MTAEDDKVCTPIDPCPKGGHHSWICDPAHLPPLCEKCNTRAGWPPPTEQVSNQKARDKWVEERDVWLAKEWHENEPEGITMEDFCTREWVKSCDKCSLGDQHAWVYPNGIPGTCSKCGKLSHGHDTGNRGPTMITKDDARKMDCPWPPEQGYDEPSPSYRDLIEIPERYHLWRSAFVESGVHLLFELEDHTWLRKKVFNDAEWEDLLSFDGIDSPARTVIQLRVNDIVNDWRERFGAP